MDLTPHLTALAAHRLGRTIDASDFEVSDLAEALERQLFKLGARTNPRGYYLDVIIRGLIGLDGSVVIPARVKSPNDLMRMDLEKEYRGYRNDWFRILDRGVPKKLRPREPLQHCRLMIQIFSNKSAKHMLDAEAKYSAVKPIIDCLTPPKQFSGSGKATTQMGISLLSDDTDGEHFRAGVVRQLEVLQAHAKEPKIRLVVEEVRPWP